MHCDASNCLKTWLPVDISTIRLMFCAVCRSSHGSREQHSSTCSPNVRRAALKCSGGRRGTPTCDNGKAGMVCLNIASPFTCAIRFRRNLWLSQLDKRDSQAPDQRTDAQTVIDQN